MSLMKVTHSFIVSALRHGLSPADLESAVAQNLFVCIILGKI